MSTLYVDSVALASEVRDYLTPIVRRDPDLARRLKRACDDVPVHVAEGMCSTGRKRRSEYGAALVSAREAIACMRAAESVGYLRDGTGDWPKHAERLLDRILSALG